MVRIETTVVVIAHNEERHIARCLQSLMRQDEPPDEIVLVAHNCNDATERIAAGFPGVRIVRLDGQPGIVFARKRGFAEARGVYVASLDADSCVDRLWLRAVLAPLRNDPAVSAVGNPTIFHGNLFHLVGTIAYFYCGEGVVYPLGRFIARPWARPWFWSTSFACRKRDFDAVGGYEPLIAQGPRLGLSEWAEDYYLSHRLRGIGRIAFTFATVTHVHSKQTGSVAGIRRCLRQQADKRKLREAFAHGCFRNAITRNQRPSTSPGNFARLVRGLDAALRRWYGICEFTADPTCLLRIELRRARSDLVLSDGTQIRPGDAVAVLHLWNEHMPRYAEPEPSLGWASVMGRRFQLSLSALAERLHAEPAWREVRAICATPAMSHRQNAPQLGRVAVRFGFEAVTSAPGVTAWLRLLGGDCLGWLLARGFNPAAAARQRFRRAQQDFWMSRRQLLARYARQAGN